jgi:hypothetical protein
MSQLSPKETLVVTARMTTLIKRPFEIVGKNSFSVPTTDHHVTNISSGFRQRILVALTDLTDTNLSV